MHDKERLLHRDISERLPISVAHALVIIAKVTKGEEPGRFGYFMAGRAQDAHLPGEKEKLLQSLDDLHAGAVRRGQLKPDQAAMHHNQTALPDPMIAPTPVPLRYGGMKSLKSP